MEFSGLLLKVWSAEQKTQALSLPRTADSEPAMQWAPRLLVSTDLMD